VTDTVDPTFDASVLIEALHGGGPSDEDADSLRLFGRFVGSWDLQWTGPGEPIAMLGELHVGWVLGGRAVQDIWIVPGRSQHSKGAARAFHGTTIRFYDHAIQAWRSTWIEPIHGRVRRFIGRPTDEGIVLLSDEEEPHLRWRFVDITRDTFTWRGEISHDGGGTWEADEQMLATRADPWRAPLAGN
jgi:hypothetical protein